MADENIHPLLIARLRTDGHGVYSIYETDRGLPDEDVLAVSNRLDAVVVTEDKDLGELVVRQRLRSAGVLLVRTNSKGVTNEQQAELVSRVIAELGGRLCGALTVVKPDGVRSRQLPPERPRMEL
ncbi:DUF5615 family PIN-like protein [Gloeobacter violaceus]|uniref:Gll2687 protein n=1 Tax=Gloeobacter violaceus (strain ATCC 29082 / PCC 7421) TaxID=251221 RepID=Q7NH50_GLOVI|nr:DUF5615 family PIN-like protein [Gloeobacter violaceus]BAC90628.1 gll2687 [Gloeobacter violaceus PCC 7421]